MIKAALPIDEEITIINNLSLQMPRREEAVKTDRSIIQARNHHSVFGSDINSKSMAYANPNGCILRPTPLPRRFRTEPSLTNYQRTERMSFANIYATWEEEQWRSIIFHDERKLNLDGPDGYTFYYHDLRNCEKWLSQRPRGGSVWVWLAVSYMGTVCCEVSETKLKPQNFMHLMQTNRDSMAQKLNSPDYVLQTTSAVYNNSPMVANWLLANSFKTQRWPDITHDINIMEALWGWLIRAVYGDGRLYARKEELKFVIQSASENIPMCLIQNLYSTMPNRMIELFYTEGRYTNC